MIFEITLKTFYIHLTLQKVLFISQILFQSNLIQDAIDVFHDEQTNLQYILVLYDHSKEVTQLIFITLLTDGIFDK
jgi:hypothetical protein